jgi:hypothetical protein
LTDSFQGGLVTKSILARLGDELETRVDGLGVLLGLDSRGHFYLILYNINILLLKMNKSTLQVVDTKEEESHIALPWKLF